MNIPFSILDLAPVSQGTTTTDALANAVDVACHAERWGYKRYWLAEHHNMPGIASAATSVLIGHVAGKTNHIRVGSGGIMLPNHAPLVVAEQFGTLATLYPNRIDLGLGRAPGTDPVTARALRRTLKSDPDLFPNDLEELQAYLSDEPSQVQAVPGTGTKVPIWLLGSSLFSAQLAAVKGLPYAFASHFAPGALHQALQTYRGMFQPSQQLEKPHTMVAVNLYAAETDEKAYELFTTVLQMFVALRFGKPGLVPPPDPRIHDTIHPLHLEAASRALKYSAVGTPETVKEKLQTIITETGADELILVSHIHEHEARLNSFEIGAQIQKELSVSAVAAS